MKKQISWLITVLLLSFVLSMGMSLLSEGIIPKINVIFGIVIILVFIFISVIFDMIGVAITAQDETPFNSMASKKIKGSSHSVKLIKNSDKLASICNDVVGDVCGVVSGSAGMMVAASLIDKIKINPSLLILLITSIIASLTITSKALGKTIAIKNSKAITERVGKVIHIFKK
jgi:CBS domain containing-hemolysin-like protein